jgi:protein-S-isoprenylcysteine O-methyltransferase Ste14
MSGVVRWFIKQGLYVLLFGILQFAIAGDLAWVNGWASVSIMILTVIGNAALILPKNPDLLLERSKLPSDYDKKDLPLAMVMAFSSFLVMIPAALQVRILDSHGSGLPFWIGVLICLTGTALTSWALYVNQFFSGVVRIQAERGHQVVNFGPYRYVRHPGYAGALIYLIGLPLLYQSNWSIAALILLIPALILRTYLEDQYLHSNLAGYPEYAASVKSRLIPGIW